MFGYKSLFSGHIPVLDSDPTNPAEGQMWILKPALFRDNFTGDDGDPLDSDSWEVVKTKTAGSVIEHAVTNGITIQGNAMQFNLAPAAVIEDGGAINISARMKKFQVDWTSEKRTIIWKQQPFSWASPWGLILESAVPIEGGDLIEAYKIRVTHSSTKTTLQIMDNSGLFCNVNYLHGESGDGIYEYKLVIDPESNVSLYQDGVLKLTSSGFPTFDTPKAWLYFACRKPGTSVTPTIRNIDDVIIR